MLINAVRLFKKRLNISRGEYLARLFCDYVQDDNETFLYTSDEPRTTKHAQRVKCKRHFRRKMGNLLVCPQGKGII